MPAPYTAFTSGSPPPTTQFLPIPYTSASGRVPLWGAWSFVSGVQGVPFNQGWDMPYLPPITYSLISGSLPPGLALATTSRTAGHISGTPTIAGTYSFTLRAVNDYGFADFAGSITIAATVTTLAPLWGVWDLPGGMKDVAYSASWDMPESAAITYTISAGSLPPGLALSALAGNEAKISGTPTTIGTFGFTITATNATGSSDKVCSIIIADNPGAPPKAGQLWPRGRK